MNDIFDDDLTVAEARQAGQLSLFLVLDGYEGPIDLLLDLARDQKIDLTQIAILPLAEQYLAYINNARELDIEVAADYLVMAAWLAYLKSRLLLPDPEPEEQMETLDMAEALRRQLLQLEAMRKAGKELMALPRLGVTRFKGAHHEQFNPVNVVSHTATLFDLLQAYGQIASREEASTLTISASHLYSVEEAVARLGDLIKYAKGWNNLLSFLPPNLKTELDHRSAIASHFTATLEMVRDGQAQLRQDNQFGPIYLASTEEHI